MWARREKKKQEKKEKNSAEPVKAKGGKIITIWSHTEACHVGHRTSRFPLPQTNTVGA